MKLPLKNIPITVTDGYILNKSANVVKIYNYTTTPTVYTTDSFKNVKFDDNCFYSNDQPLLFEECNATTQDPEILDPITMYSNVTLLTDKGLTEYKALDSNIYRTYLDSGETKSIATCGSTFWMNVGRNATYDPKTERYKTNITFWGLRQDDDGKWYLTGGDSCTSSPETIVVDSLSVGTFSQTKYNISQAITLK